MFSSLVFEAAFLAGDEEALRSVGLVIKMDEICRAATEFKTLSCSKRRLTASKKRKSIANIVDFKLIQQRRMRVPQLLGHDAPSL